MYQAGDISKATEMLFDERKNFIIIGLTGRTGSGCSTVANLLIKSFQELQPPKPKEQGLVTNEERKYQIVYKYAEKNWKDFIVIQTSNIITSFLLEFEFQDFLIFLDKYKDSVANFSELKEKLIRDDLKQQFTELHKQRLRIKSEIEQHGDTALDDDKMYKFYFEQIPTFTNKLKEVLSKHQTNLYTYIYQRVGNNIRTSGNPYDKEFNPENIFRLSQRTNKLIKILRKRNLKIKGRVLVVIDALRNPYEATFFKDRYSAFYLFSVNTDDNIRRERLLNKGLDLSEIKLLDEQEYPIKQVGIDKFSSQNIQKCLEISDVHLYNPTVGPNNYNFLKEQLMKYISLIMHPGLISPTHLERSMQIAFNAKLNSGCISRQVGAVVTGDDYSIKAIGWNSAPEGQVPCNLRSIDAFLSKEDIEAFSDYENNDERYFDFIKKTIERKKVDRKVLKGRTFCFCFKDSYNALEKKKNQVHTRALHAEENAFLQIAKHGGVGIKAGYLFTTASPCELCSKKAYQLGIKTVYYIDPYPGISNKHILQAGKNRPNMKLFYGAIGRAYHQFYTQIIPYKDELSMLLDFEF